MTDNTNVSNAAADASTVDTATAPAPQKRRGRPVDPNSGLARARALYASAPDTTRAVMVKRMVEELGLSKDTAGAYHSLITKG